MDKYKGQPVHVVANLAILKADVSVNMLENSFFYNGCLLFPATMKNLVATIEMIGVERYWKELIYPVYGFVLGTWECQFSPWGVCIYDHDKDKAHDHCILCGHPDERK